MSLDRRQVLTNAALGGAGIVGATALGSVGPEAAFAAEVETPDGECADYVGGIITSVNGTQVMVERGDGVMQRAIVTNGTSIWKLRPTSFDAIEVGDFFDARGVPMDDGALAADAVWVNIVQYMAHIVSIRHNRIDLEHNGYKVTGHVIPGTTVASYNSTPAISDLSPLEVGQHVQVLGAQRPGTKHLEIATIFAVV